uniref:Secreted protein n=1 Tax=Heterorhabditis bacteriophora TaxID=37862 RepID=A0A1I7W657_HETBA
MAAYRSHGSAAMAGSAAHRLTVLILLTMGTSYALQVVVMEPMAQQMPYGASQKHLFSSYPSHSSFLWLSPLHGLSSTMYRDLDMHTPRIDCKEGLFCTYLSLLVSSNGGVDASRNEVERDREADSPDPPSTTSESNGIYTFPPPHDMHESFHFTPNSSPQLVRREKEGILGSGTKLMGKKLLIIKRKYR